MEKYDRFVEVPEWKRKNFQMNEKQQELMTIHNNAVVHNYAMRDALRGIKLAPKKKRR